MVGSQAGGAPANIPDKPEIVLLLHGMTEDVRGGTLKRLQSGIEQACSQRNIVLPPVEELDEARRLYRIAGRAIEIREIYWVDLQPRFETLSILKKLMQSLAMVAFWASSPSAWRVALRSKQLAGGIMLFFALFVAWYLLTLTAIGASDLDSVFGTGDTSWIRQAIEWARDGLQHIGGPWVWLGITILVGSLGANFMLNAGYVGQAYLVDRDQFRFHALGRLFNALSKAEADGRPDRPITVLAHSLGAALAVEALQRFAATRPFRLVTLAGPLEMMAARQASLRQVISDLLAKPQLACWVDIWSPQDWMCTRTPAGPKSKHYRQCRIDRPRSLTSRTNRKVHYLYFTDDAVVQAALQLTPADAATLPSAG